MLLLPLLSGCVNLYDPESSQDNHSEIVVTLQTNQQFTQYFISRNPGLSEFIFWVSVTPDTSTNQATLEITLYPESNNSSPMYHTDIIYYSPQYDTQQKIVFPPQQSPIGQVYRIILECKQGSIDLRGKNEDIYPLGNTWLNDKSVQADLAFYTYYHYGVKLLIRDFYNNLANLWLIIPLFILLIFPGWLLVTALKLNKDSDFGEQVGLSIGLSISLYGILFSWTSLLKIHWTRQSAIAIAGFIIFLGTYFLINKIRSIRFFRINHHSILLIIIFFGASIIRLIMVRDLVTSPWVDSVQHALITRMIVESGLLPQNYAPFIDIQKNAYHSGFHSLLAFFYWLSGMKIYRALLFLGQILNALSVFTTYLFTLSLTRNKIASIVAAVIVAFLSPMPSYYTSWGRYPQLAALLIFPTTVSLCNQLIQNHYDQTQPRKVYRMIIAASLSLAGLAITHYRVCAFFICFLLARLVIYLIKYSHSSKRLYSIKTVFMRIGLVTALSLILTIPWFPQTVLTFILPRLIPNKPTIPFADFSVNYLTSASGNIVLVLAALGTLFGIIKRKIFVFLLIIWICMLFFIANMGALRLPGGSFINNNSVVISLFLPLSVISGFACSYVFFLTKKLLPFQAERIINFLALMITITAAGFGSCKLISILNPITFLAREADFEAMPAIQSLTTKEDVILINPFLWGYNLYAGNDGGYWISATIDRMTIPPPVLYGLSSNKIQIKRIVDISKQTIAESRDTAELARLMKENNIRYIYIGARGGILSSYEILKSPDFNLKFHQGNVWFFEVNQP